MALPADLLSTALATVPSRRRLVIGVSGGVDSMLLLDCVRDAIARAGVDAHAGVDGQLPVLAVHVHHGLNPHADDWAGHVAQTCAEAGIDCVVKRVAVARNVASREAAARSARYAAFHEVLKPGDALLLAHHADDQAETFLLRLLRGSGLSGLGAMRKARLESAVPDCWLLRPLLDLPRSTIEAEARRRGLRWVEDPSNADPSIDRNLLRHEVLPGLGTRWPAVIRTLAATARRLAEADGLLNEYLDRDLPALLVADPLAGRPVLAVEPLLARRPAAQRALLRRWLARIGAPVLQEDWIDQLLAIAAARADAEGKLLAGGWEFHRYRGRLFAFPQLPPCAVERAIPWPEPAAVLDLGAAHGRLLATGAGLALALPAGEPVCVRFRVGGERLTPAGGSGSRPLKKVLQDTGLPPWLRARVPLLYVGDRLAAVGDRVADAAFVPAPGRPATLHLRWETPGD